MRHLWTLLGLGLALAVVAGCEATDVETPPAASDELPVGAATADEGKLGFGAAEALDAKEDGFGNTPGPAVGAGAADTEVWKVTNQWADTETPAARKAGLAWGEDSGLTWDEKYAAWVDALPRVDGYYGYPTYEMTTPYGKTLPAPAVECAETAIFLRATFASWYGLPFFLQGVDERGNRVYLGHFGFRTATGKYGNTPAFKTAYRDYSDRADTWQTAGWPKDEKLRGRKLGGSQDDEQPALADDAHAGTYFDELFLNKRVGHFMIFALSYFGSVNLADPVNTFNVKPEALREGDVLIERWQRLGIGHTLVVKKVEAVAPDALAAELISGSMPRRQAKWDDAATSRMYLLNPYTGGPDESDEPGVPYAKLGGGLKRWRTPVAVNGKWANLVPEKDRPFFIDANNTTAIAERHVTLEKLLRDVPPDEKRGVLLKQIDDARAHLNRYPASCSARERREDAFEALYDLESEHFERTRSQVDAEHRKLEDFVFGELDYEQSKTCCWNSTTVAMAEIVLSYAAKEQADAQAAGECRAPTVFRARDGGYQLWAEYAATLGRAAEWKAWSEDEPCAQRDVTNDTEAEMGATPWCEIPPAP